MSEHRLPACVGVRKVTPLKQWISQTAHNLTAPLPNPESKVLEEPGDGQMD